MSSTIAAEAVYRQNTHFTPADTDGGGRVLCAPVVYRLQQAADAHFSFLELGREAAAANGSFWVLVRTELSVFRWPECGETLCMETWTGRHSHGLFPRHYCLRTPEGQILLRAASVWALADRESRTLSADHAWADTAPQISLPGELPGPLRAPRLPQILSQRLVRTVTEADADENGHLNNASYIRWAEELLPEDFCRERTLRHLVIEYRKELPLGRSGLLEYDIQQNSLFLRGKTEGKEFFSLRADYDSFSK